MANLNCKKPKPCPPNKKPPRPKPCSPAFNICVGDRTLKWDGFCPTIERTRHTPDGTYTSVTVIDGCIVGYGYADEPTYTPPYCSSNPTSCQTNVGSGSMSYTISPNSDNSLVQSASGLFARTFVQGSGNIQVTGKGTVHNPYVVSFSGSTDSTTVVGEAGIIHRNRGNVTYVGLEPTGVTKGMYNGFSINEYGQIVGFSDSVVRNQSAVAVGAGLIAQDNGSQTVISHVEYDLPANAVFGGYVVKLNKSGHITDLNRIATVNAGTYTVGAYQIAISEYGSITSITQSTEVPSKEGVFVTTDNKIVTYDISGRITKVNEIPTNLIPPKAVRDMYKFTIKDNAVKKEAYGNDVTISNITEKTFDIQLPDYITQDEQVQVNGAVSHSLSGSKLTITHTGSVVTPNEKIITLILRA